MKKCQIMTYGGKHYWIDLAHRKNPEINWFIFVGAPFENPESKPDHWEDIYEKIDELEEKQKNFPEAEKIKYTYLEVDFQNNITELIRYFRELIDLIEFQSPIALIPGSTKRLIRIDITSGIFEMRIALFIAAQILRYKISEIFYINKQTLESSLLLVDFRFPKHGKKVLKLLGKAKEENRREEFSLSEFKDVCKENGFDTDLPALSRLVKNLRKKGYIEERREGRKKYIKITDLGSIFYRNRKYREEISKELYPKK